MFYAKDFVGIEIFEPNKDIIKDEYVETFKSQVVEKVIPNPLLYGTLVLYIVFKKETLPFN